MCGLNAVLKGVEGFTTGAGGCLDRTRQFGSCSGWQARYLRNFQRAVLALIFGQQLYAPDKATRDVSIRRWQGSARAHTHTNTHTHT